MGTMSRNSSPPTQVQSSSSSATLDNNMSNNNKLNNSGSTITTAKSSIYTASNETTIDLNDLRLSDHTQHTDSFGNSSLSSFLSVLLEDEESSEFLIVQDNPKVPASEQRSIRDIRVAFSSNATELNDDSNHKTKSRWDYLVREHSDNDLLYTSSRRSRRAGHQIRSSSFSDAIPSTMVKMSELRRSASDDSATVSPGDNSTKGNSNSNRFLRMPRRQRSPTEDEIGKKSLYDRLNQSDSALLDTRLPMPSRPPRRDSRNINYYSSATSLGGRGYGERRLKRSGTYEKSNANASWSKTDLRARRNEEHNRFFDIMMEPDGDAAAGRASPTTNSLSTLQSSSSSAFHESMSMLNNNNNNNSIGELLISLSDNDDDHDNDNDNSLQSSAFQESMSMLNNNNNNNSSIGELSISLSDNDNDVDNDNDNSLLSSSSSAFQESTLIHNDSMKDLTSLLMSTKIAHHKKKKKSSSSSPPPEIDNHE